MSSGSVDSGAATSEPMHYETKGGVCKVSYFSAFKSHLLHRPGPEKFSSRVTAERVAAAHNWDGRGKVVIITGANSGLGKESARVLAARGAEVIMAVRDTARGQQAADEIRIQHPGAQLTVMKCDLSSLASVHAFADSFKKSGKPCHVIMANAGLMAHPHELTVDGHEVHFATNHLGHFALVQQLLPVLKETGKSAGEPARVVVLSSASHMQTYAEKEGGPVRLDRLESQDGYHPFLAYGQSKLCNLLFMRELNKRMQADGAPVIAAACHPGLIATDLGRHVSRDVNPLLVCCGVAFLLWAFKKPRQGAATQVYLCTSPNIQGGEYYTNCSIIPSTSAAHDAALGAKLWELSERLVAQAEKAGSYTATVTVK